MQAVWVWAIIRYRGRRIDVENWMRISSENWMGHSVAEMCVWALLYVLVWQHFLFFFLSYSSLLQRQLWIGSSYCYCERFYLHLFLSRSIFLWNSLDIFSCPPPNRFCKSSGLFMSDFPFSNNSINSTDSKDTFLMRFNIKAISLSLTMSFSF